MLVIWNRKSDISTSSGWLAEESPWLGVLGTDDVPADKLEWMVKRKSLEGRLALGLVWSEL